MINTAGITRHTADGTADRVQACLTRYASAFNYDDLTPAAIQTAKARIIDTLGALICGFFAEPCRIARNLAAQLPNSEGATVIGTRLKTVPDLAAFVNGTTARYVEMTDVYHWGHPSDVILPLLAVAEHAGANGQEFIAGVVLGYEVYQSFADAFPNKGFDNTNFCCLGTAVAAGKLLSLSHVQLAHCISMATVSGNVLRQVRLGEQSMFKTAATGHAGRTAVFAALLARAGMEGPHLPFEGKAGWNTHVARGEISLDTLGCNASHFKIVDTRIKMRSSVGTTISSVLAAEKIAPLENPEDVQQVTVEVYKRAKETVGTGRHVWNPESRETADHSIPYVVAAALMDGTVTPRSFDAAHLRNQLLRRLMQKIEVVENEEFTRANERSPSEHHTRVTVVTRHGERFIGESGADKSGVSANYADAEITEKFRALTLDFLGPERVNMILNKLWRLEDLRSVAEIPPSFVIN